MPLSLADLSGQLVAVTLQFGDDSLTLKYYPERISSEHIRRFLALRSVAAEDASNPEAAFDKLDEGARFLSEVLGDWDLHEWIKRDAEGTVLELGPKAALSAERIAKLGIMVVWRMVGALMGEMRLGEPTAPASPKRSSATASKARKASSRR